MSQKEKLIKKLRSRPKDFTFEELETLLGYFSYRRSNKGRTSGSRVSFVNEQTQSMIMLHKPHSRKNLLDYQMKQIKNQLEEEGLI